MAKCDICGLKFKHREPRRTFAFEEGLTHIGKCEEIYIAQRKKWEHCSQVCKGKNFFPKCLKIQCKGV